MNKNSITGTGNRFKIGRLAGYFMFPVSVTYRPDTGYGSSKRPDYQA
jgi:hypothetical protein